MQLCSHRYETPFGCAVAAGVTSLREALLARRSVRRYEKRSVSPAVLDAIRDCGPDIEPLEPGLGFRYSIVDATAGADITAAMGAYGRIISAPHVLVATIEDDLHALVDFGFRVEQIVIRLTRLGLGSCWVGALPREARAAERFNVPPGWRIPAVVAFGYPATGIGGAVNSLIHIGVGAQRPLDFAKFVSSGKYGQPAALSEVETNLLDALRRAPSAGNTRPWRVILKDSRLFYCVDAAAGFYRTYKVDYPLVDAGIGMANTTLALNACRQARSWTLLADDHCLRTELALPDNLRLIASISLPV
jgi:nitroreductase